VTQLMTISEMQIRYQRKEDPFDLAIEKWIRIRQFLNTASTLGEFKELLQATNIAVPFCFEYQKNDCLGCPLESICGPGKEEKLFKIMRLIQIHHLAILAGNMLPNGPLISKIDGLIGELKMLKERSIEKYD